MYLSIFGKQVSLSHNLFMCHIISARAYLGAVNKDITLCPKSFDFLDGGNIFFYNNKKYCSVTLMGINEAGEFLYADCALDPEDEWFTGDELTLSPFVPTEKKKLIQS